MKEIRMFDMNATDDDMIVEGYAAVFDSVTNLLIN